MNLKRYCYVAVLALSGLWSGTVLAELTGQYLFEGNANDSSPFGRNGTITGGTFTAGLYQGSTSALLQTAAGNTVQLPPSSDFIRNVPGATLLAWVRADDISATRNIVVVNNSDPAGAGGIGTARALLEFSIGNGLRAIGRQLDSGGSSAATGLTPVIGQTYFLAGVFDYVNGDVFLYIDGQQAASNLSTGWTGNAADTPNLAARIGSHADGAQQHWIGALDGVRIFNNAMTATEILNLYNAETFPPPLPGDTDNDGMVELEDLTPIRDNWRLTGQTRLQGNLSGDTAGLVDFTDFRQWKTACLADNCAGSGSLDGVNLGFLSVPEPSAFALVVLGLVSVGVTRRRCRRRCG